MISVIIPTWNEADHLPATLAAVEANNFTHEVLVVDASSDDGTLEVAREFGAPDRSFWVVIGRLSRAAAVSP